MSKIFGRDEEVKLLNDFLKSNEAKFLALYGRRRVGKTYLIRNFFSVKNNVIFFDVSGLKNASMQHQIENFTTRIGEVFFQGVTPRQEKNWEDTFRLLTKIMEQIPKNKKIVLFFDELPWMATANSKLLQNIDYYWNQYWSKDSRIRLVICGSSTSWIIDKIIDNKAGLHNRVTHKILLEPFKLSEARKFLISQNINITKSQMLPLYMVTGGVPFYLSYYKKGLSVAQNIEQIAFQKNSLLLGEFDNLFSSLFENPELYISIIRLISKNWSGISQESIFREIEGLSKGGEGQKKLKALEDSGFIKKFIPFQNKKRGIYYKLIDEYSLFYLKWIEPIKNTLFTGNIQKGYWVKEMKSQNYSIWSGYAFEIICYKHVLQISKALGIEADSIPYTWRYVPKKGKDDQGAQIDLLFDRTDDAITICEIKYYNDKFKLTKEYLNILDRKKRVFEKQTSTKKQIFISLIASNGVAKTYYADKIIDNVITIDDLF